MKILMRSHCLPEPCSITQLRNQVRGRGTITKVEEKKDLTKQT